MNFLYFLLPTLTYAFYNLPVHLYSQNIKGIDNFEMSKKYQFLDKIFLKVLKNNPEKMVNIFQKMFKVNETSIIKFLSNKSDFKEDLSIILKMPKWTFIKALM